MFSYGIFMIISLFSVTFFASFWDRFREVFWLVFGSTFEAFGGLNKATKMSIQIDVILGIEKIGSEEARVR